MPALSEYARRKKIEYFLSGVPKSARILYIVPGDQLTSRIPLFEDARSTSLFCHDERFDDDEFISSATKALRGEVFGLQKYFPWGVTTFTMMVKNYEEKGRAIDIMMRYTQMAGVRGPVRDRIGDVARERRHEEGEGGGAEHEEDRAEIGEEAAPLDVDRRGVGEVQQGVVDYDVVGRPGDVVAPEPASATLAILGVFGFGMRALRRRTPRR